MWTVGYSRIPYDPAGFWWAVGHDNSVSVMQRLDA